MLEIDFDSEIENIEASLIFLNQNNLSLYKNYESQIDFMQTRLKMVCGKSYYNPKIDAEDLKQCLC